VEAGKKKDRLLASCNAALAEEEAARTKIAPLKKRLQIESP
jgi:hypothetical protein